MTRYRTAADLFDDRTPEERLLESLLVAVANLRGDLNRIATALERPYLPEPPEPTRPIQYRTDSWKPTIVDGRGGDGA